MCKPKIIPHTKTELTHFNKAIRDLLKIGAISECDPCDGQFLSNVFLRPKPNGKMRFILNLKPLNKFIETDHFKIEDFRTAVKLVSRDCFMANLDLKDAYHLININPVSRKYLRFEFCGKLYEFNVLPFGLNKAPYIFTKIMKPIIKLLRTCGYLSTVYLDDIFLLGQTKSECLENINTTKKLLTSLGFVINMEKSNLSPSMSCKFLGYVINSKKFQVTLPDEKRKNIKVELTKMMNCKRCKIRKFAHLIGLLVSACPAIEYGALYTKDFERCKFLNLRGHEDYNRYMDIPESLQTSFKWWIKEIDTSVRPIRIDEYCTEIYSDASTTGWGAACGTEKASGVWSQEERESHINELELLAAYIGLKIFAKELHNCQILLRIDNSTAIAYINRMGGIQYPHLTKISKMIWQWCEARNIFIYASYIKSGENVIADAESRKVHPDIEWELADTAFKMLVEKLGCPEVDLFASRINNKCVRYVSWHRDPDAFAVNAFTVRWTRLKFYAFPPFAIILKTLRKIISDKASGIMVVPKWPTQPWFPIFQRLLVSETIEFQPNENVIISHSSKRNILENVTLVAGVLCGQRYCDAAYRHQQLTS